MKLNQIRFCAEEIARQKDGPLAVAAMCDGFSEMANLWNLNSYPRAIWDLYPESIIRLHRIVMPEGPHGWAKVPRVFANGKSGVHPDNIARSMDSFIEGVRSNWFTPLGAYTEFELIHPFVDGNGRVGAILYNWLNKTLDNPQTPPDIFGERE